MPLKLPLALLLFFLTITAFAQPRAVTVNREIKEKQDIAVEKCLLKVSKVLTDVLDQPKLIRALTDYPLFAIDQETGRVVEYINFLEEKTEDFFWMKMVDLAYDINAILAKDEHASNVRSIYAKKT